MDLMLIEESKKMILSCPDVMAIFTIKIGSVWRILLSGRKITLEREFSYKKTTLGVLTISVSNEELEEGRGF